MKRSPWFGGLFVLAIAAVIFLSRNDKNSAADDGIITPAAVRSRLVERLKNTAPNSPEAREISRMINKVRRKANVATDKEAENPSAFIEALAKIKTARNGSTYSHNYKIRELQKALVSRSRLSKRSAATLPWVERGPGNVSGRARALIVDPDDPTGNTWFVASIGGGIWKTTNAGLTWQNKTPELTTLSTTTIAMAASNHNVIYAGTGMGYGRVVDLEGSGVWKSIDRGETWTQLASTANGQLLDAINRIVVDPNNENVVLVCSNDAFSHLGTKGGSRKSGIFRSVDGGQSWIQVYDPDVALGTATDNRVQQIIANPKNFNTLYAAVNEVGVIKSVDAGLTWFVSANNFALPSDIGNPPGGGFGLAGISVRTELAISPTDTSRIYAAVERPRGVADLYMSKNAGATWVLVNDTGNDPNWFNSFGQSGASGAYTAGWFDNTIVVHPYDANIVFVGGVNLYRLNINPTTNTRASTLIAYFLSGQGVPYAHADHHFLVTIPVNQATGAFRIVDANDGGVALSNNGGVNWTQITGMVTTQFYGADKKPGEDVYIGGMQDNGTWSSGTNPDANSPWTFDLGGDGFEVAWHDVDPNLVLATQQFGIYHRSADAGLTWNPITAAQAGPSPFISKIGNSSSDPDLVFTIGLNGVNRSDDFGETWTLTPIAGNWLGYRPFDNVEVSLADAQVVWISSRMDIDPPAGFRGGIHVSTDGGLSFTEISQNFPSSVTESSGLATHPADPATAYFLFSAPGSPKILRTRDFGNTFEDLSQFHPVTKTSANGFPDVAVFSMLVMPFDTDILWAGTEIGLFLSEDGGATWTYTSDELPHVAIFAMKIVDDQVLLATQGRGIWSVTLPELAGYNPPTPTLSPRLRTLALKPTGEAVIGVDLRSAYDSTVVELDGSAFATIGPNFAATDTTFLYPVAATRTIIVAVTSFKDGREFKSATRSLNVFPAVARSFYSSDLNSATAANDFSGNGFSVQTAAGFSNPAIHSAHPYTTAASFIYMLNVPIKVAASEATLEYDDVAIVEEGTDPYYTDPNFWDYVIVEGTKDGLNWLPLIDGYDARANPQWSAAYNAVQSGNQSMFVHHSINLRDRFQTGEVIFVRFRLYSDPAVVAWGWAIDNLEIQTSTTVVENEEDSPRVFNLAQNYPNPFNPSTNITYDLARDTPVNLKIYNLAGQLVRTLVNHVRQNAGTHTVSWKGEDDEGMIVASGVYLYRVEAGDFVDSRKMILLR